MRKLLSANFLRLWKDKVFWICMGAMLVYSVVYMMQAISLPESNYNIDKYYFHFVISIGAFCAIFCSMFFGTEYSDGTIRNKLVVGHTRTSIYLANFILTFSATLIIMLVWLIGALIAIPTLGIWEMGIAAFILYLIVAVLFVAAFSAIFIFVSMNSLNKAMTVILSILLFLGLLIVAGMIESRLSQPETISGIAITRNGIDMSEKEPNPYYVTADKRKMLEFVSDVLPTGQAINMASLTMNHPIRMMISSIIITIVTILIGVSIFKRKNIK